VLAFERGAKLLLITKGITERGRGATVFGSERLQRLPESSNAESAAEICEAVLRDAYDFLHPRKLRHRDDFTAVTLVRTGSEL
jgi:serine phosphatase RsbU (regulator of sigma subunit)